MNKTSIINILKGADMSRLERYHPIIVFLYFLMCIITVMFTMHPVIIILSFVISIALSFQLEGCRKVGKSLLYIIPIMIIIALTNPLFVHDGGTELFFMNGNAVTLEALIYGVMISLKLVSIIYWFRAYNYIMTSDKVIYLFGKVSPRLSLLLTMSLRFVPLYARKFREADDASRALGAYATRNIKDKLMAKLHVFAIVFSYSIESAVTTSDSMSARGYGMRRRTNYHNFKWSMSDTIMFLFVALGCVTLATIMILGYSGFDYYPYVDDINIGVASIVMYVSYFCLASIGMIMEIKEAVSWSILRSKI